MQPRFKPLPPRALRRRPELFKVPAEGLANKALLHLDDLIGIGLLFGMMKLAKSLAIPKRHHRDSTSHLDPRKQINPKTSFLPG